jgi:hypothetical protein
MRPPTKKEAPCLEASGAVRAAKHQTKNNIIPAMSGVNARMVQGWMRRGQRIAESYLLTKNETHRIAFERHMGGILQRVGGAAI